MAKNQSSGMERTGLRERNIQKNKEKPNWGNLLQEKNIMTLLTFIAKER